MRPLRRIVFWLFVIAYVAATPVAILYALGYIWKPGSDVGLVKTGLIALASTPEDATIFLGGRRYTRPTPATIRDLLPGAYEIRLSHPGYEDWGFRALVRPERATVLDRILLLPSRRALRAVADGPWDDLHAAAQGRDLLLRRGTAWFVLDARDPSSPPREITNLLPGPPDEVALDRQNRLEFFVRIKERVFRIDLEENAIYPDVAPPARRIGTHRGRLVIETPDGTRLRLNRRGEAIAEPPIPPNFFGRGHSPLAPDADEARWLFADGRRLGIVERIEDADEELPRWNERILHQHSSPIQRAGWAHDDSHVLFSSRGALWLLALDRGGAGPPRVVCEISRSGAFHFDEASGRIFAIDPSGRLGELNLVPPRLLIPLPVRGEDIP
ncbi:MAG: PEGA domain-containing protein [Kiritimatiellae bacterium]|nr:PEGA domain-containing protein [Kiritimatiellia bacterium]MDW8457915.1 PEGA domain-containing protein [Verrucomicrobiota bacterium]